MIRTADDERVVGLQRIDEIEEQTVLDDENAEAGEETVTANADAPTTPESDAGSNEDSDADK